MGVLWRKDHREWRETSLGSITEATELALVTEAGLGADLAPGAMPVYAEPNPEVGRTRSGRLWHWPLWLAGGALHVDCAPGIDGPADPGGRLAFPAGERTIRMPRWRMSDGDPNDLVAYLKTLE